VQNSTDHIFFCSSLPFFLYLFVNTVEKKRSMSDDTHGNNDLNQRMGKEGEKKKKEEV
jgi:hypothetical protein